MMSTVFAEGRFTLTQSGSFRTLRWDSGFAIQLDRDEWADLVAAVDEHRVLLRDEEAVRTSAEIRESL